MAIPKKDFKNKTKKITKNQKIKNIELPVLRHPNDIPLDGDIKRDDKSPSGYSKYTFGKWVHLEIAKKKKKKSNIKTSDLTVESLDAAIEAIEKFKEKSLRELNEKSRIDLNEKSLADALENVQKFRELDSTIHKTIERVVADKLAVICESGEGYCTAICRKVLSIQDNKNAGAGFQPYESVKEREIFMAVRFVWGPQVNMASGLTHDLRSIGLPATFVYTPDDILSFFK